MKKHFTLDHAGRRLARSRSKGSSLPLLNYTIPTEQSHDCTCRSLLNSMNWKMISSPNVISSLPMHYDFEIDSISRAKPKNPAVEVVHGDLKGHFTRIRI